MSEDKRTDKEYFRDRLIGCIPKELLITGAAKELRERLEATRTLLANTPYATFSTSSRKYTDDMYLEEKGVDPKQPQNQALRAHFQAMDAFEGRNQNSHPPKEAVADILPTLKAVFELLQKPASPAPSPEIVQMAWSKMGQCCETISPSLTDPASADFKFIRGVLLTCAKHELPKASDEPEDADSAFDSPSWSPLPRNEAARGLPWLGLRAKDIEIMAAVEALAKDKVPSVRYLIANELFRFSEIDPDFYWRNLTARADAEKSPGVQLGICGSLRYTIARNDKAGVEVLKRLVNHIDLSDDRSQLLDSVLALIMWLVLEKKDPWAIEVIERVLNSPAKYPASLKRLTFQALSAMTPAELSTDPGMFDTAGGWLTRFLESAIGAVAEFRKKPDSEWNEEMRETFRDVYGSIDEVVMRFYFAAEIKEHGKPSVKPIEQCAFFAKITPYLERIVTSAMDAKHGVLLASTAHHLMELLHASLRCNPKGILNLAKRVALASAPFNYNLDSMAAGEVVRLVETVLADYRTEVQDGESLEDVLTLLDVFAQAGWPQAQQLVWRLDEVFR